MAGNENNSDILAAFNQSIAAINDLAAAIGSLVLQTEVNNTCTPQVTCTSNVTVLVPPSGGRQIESTSGQENGTPPAGYVAPASGTTNRKCKVANMIYDQTLLTIQKLAVLDMDTYANIGFVLCCSLVGGILASEVPILGTLVGLVAGAIIGVAIELVTAGTALDLSDLQTIYVAYHADLVCSLYGATSAEGARGAFLDALNTAGASLLEAQLVAFLIPNDVMNLLFFTLESSESSIDAWATSVDCDECGAPVSELIIHIIPGSPWGFLSRDGADYVLTAEHDTGAGLWRLNFQFCESDNLVNLHCCEISGWTSDESFDANVDNWLGPCQGGGTFLPKPFVQSDIQGFKQLALAAHASFAVSFTVVGEYTP